VKKPAKKAVAYVEARGYVFERQNAKGFLFYRSLSGHEIGINPGCDEAGCKRVIHDIDRACGLGPDLSQKRNVEQVKARRERERTLVIEEKLRHRERLDALARERSAVLLGGRGDALSLRQVKDIERRIEAEMAEYRDTVRLMTATPQGGAA
jgi:hypothetical protein